MSNYFPIKDPVLIFAVVAALILLSPILLGRYRLPGMIGLLLAGAILGPNALGVLARDQSFVLFGTVGLLYIMFVAALEIDLAVFKRYSAHSIIFGLITFALPQGLGTAFAYYLLDFNLLPALLLGSVFASHTLLAYPIASRLGIGKSQAITTAVGGTILTDTLSLLVLAVIAGTTRGEMNEAFWYRLGISITLYVVIILIGLPRLARWFFRRISQDGVSEFVFVLAIVFGCGSLSHLVGVEPIVGAFLAGLALNRLIPHSSTLMSRIQFTGEAVFIPFFLLSVGMLLDVRIFLGGPRSWLIAFGMTACVILTKWLAAESTRIIFRYHRNEARVIFGLTVAQAAATLAATIVGYELGFFDDAVVNGSILMIIATCILAPVIVNKYGHPLAEIKNSEMDEPAGPPQRILVALANPSAAHPLIELAQLIREPSQHQPIYPLTVVEESQRATDKVAKAEKMLLKAVVQLSAADIPASPLTRIDLNIPSGIRRARRDLRATDVIIGWAGRTTTTEFFFGSILEKLVADSDYTLVVSRLVELLNVCQRVLLAVPPHAEQERSFPAMIRIVRQLVRQLGAKLVVLTVKSHEEQVKKRIQGIKPTVACTSHSLEDWSGLTQALADVIRDTDMLVLHELRAFESVWRPGPSHVPDRLANRFPNTNLLVIYPAEPSADTLSIQDSTFDTENIHFTQERIFSDLQATSLEEAIQYLLLRLPEISDEKTRTSLGQKLFKDAEELTSGVILVHAETPLVQTHGVALAVSREGFEHSLGKERAHILVLLVDPLGKDAAPHLKYLASIARIFHSSTLVEKAKTAKDTHDLLALFRVNS